MNQSTYKIDYLPYDWMQNNITSNASFCSSENIDDCLRYISQEFSALGYPSIYTNENNCKCSANCDVVQLLNITHELLGTRRDLEQAKDDLECRNRCLLEDFKAVTRKNSLLKENLEQSERRYKGALEKDRQSKEKNKELTQLLKIEKDESKRLASQMQQQKKTYQHEIRKSENNMSQMKSRLNQMLADKNPNKKIANITSSNLLPRNSSQRGKWKTGSVAKSNFEEMYATVISSYDTRCKEMLKEISTFHSCLEFIQGQMLEIISKLKESGNNTCSSLVPLQALFNGNNLQKSLEERFSVLLEKIKDFTLQKGISPTNQPNAKVALSESKHPHCSEKDYDKINKAITCETVNQESEHSDQPSNSYSVSMKELESEKEKLKKEKTELAATLLLIAKEKSELEVQKLDAIKMALRQEERTSQWHHNLHTVPAFSVIQTSSGVTAVPCAKQLRSCLSAPDQHIQTLAPLWNSHPLKQAAQSTSEPSPHQVQNTTPPPLGTEPEKHTAPEDSNLPKWAIAAIHNTAKELPLITESSFSNEDLNISTVSSSEEQNLVLLRSAMNDIENRRKQVS